MNEFDTIKTLFKPLAENSPYALGFSDDAAILPFSDNRDLIISKDLLNQGTHFFTHTKPADVAARLLRTNLSDLAAMGAEPLGYFLGIASTKDTSHTWLTQFSEALHTEIKTFGGTLLGGDTTYVDSPNRVLSLTALGTTPKGTALRRSGAQIGDHIYVTGTIGDSYLALNMLQQKLPLDSSLLERYNSPTPRLAIGQKLRNIAHAAIDISDGLIADLEHLCSASNCGATIIQAQIPLSQNAQSIIESHSLDTTSLYTAGDDYELIFTAPASKHEHITRIAQHTQTPITQIGSITDKQEVVLMDHNNTSITLPIKGYQHRL